MINNEEESRLFIENALSSYNGEPCLFAGFNAGFSLINLQRYPGFSRMIQSSAVFNRLSVLSVLLDYDAQNGEEVINLLDSWLSVAFDSHADTLVAYSQPPSGPRAAVDCPIYIKYKDKMYSLIPRMEDFNVDWNDIPRARAKIDEGLCLYILSLLIDDQTVIDRLPFNIRVECGII